MDRIYLIWAALAVFFLLLFLLISVREARTADKDESALDPMFRSRPATGGTGRTGNTSRPERKGAAGGRRQGT